MDPYQNGTVFSSDGEEGGDMDQSFLSQTTMRGNSFEQVQQELSASFGHHGINYANSLGSSERYGPYERYDPSNPALSVTSGTTWTDIDPSGSSTFPVEEAAPQGPIPPVEAELAGITGGPEVDQDFIDALLQHERISPTSILPGRSIARGALMGLTRETQPRVSHQPVPEDALTQAIVCVDDFSRKVLSHTECSPDLLQQTKQSLVHLTEHVNDLLRNRENHSTVSYDPPAPPSSTGSTPVTRYKCQECDKLDTDLKGTFTRHVNDMHFPRRKFFCPEKGCHDVWKPRQHQIRTHVLLAHRREPTKGELLLHKRDMPCPHQCPGCSLPIRTWDEFTKCYREHCTYKVSSNSAVASRRGSADHGNGRKNNGPNNDQLMQGISMGNPGPAHPHCALNSTTEQGRYPHFFSEAIGPANHTARPQGASHRLPCDWARRNASPNHSQGNLPQPHNPRNPTPGDADYEMARRQFGAINGGTQDMRPCASRQEPDLGCRRCPHKFRNCPQCRNRTESTPFCHQCPEFPRIVAGIRLQLGHDPLPGQQAYSPTINPSLLTPGYHPQPGISQDTQGQFPPQNQQDRGPQFQGWTFPRGMGPTYSGTRRNNPGNNPGNNPRAMPVMNIDETGLSEQEMEIPSVFDLKDTTFQGALLSMLPMMAPLKNWFSKPLKGLSSLALNGLDLITQIDEPPGTIAAVNPSGECKCACRARARERAELASGRQLEMKFKLSPQYRGTSHLRTRVDIVVKLLKLRSSVSKSKAKREEAESAITHAFEPDVSDESDTDSVFDEDDNDALTTSSSFPDLMSLIPATSKPSPSACPDIPSDDSLLSLHDDEGEKTSEGDILIELNLDLESVLHKLSKWTGGFSGDIFSDMCISDPGRVFRYLTAYILYVIMSLARSRDYGHPHLDN